MAEQELKVTEPSIWNYVVGGDTPQHGLLELTIVGVTNSEIAKDIFMREIIKTHPDFSLPISELTVRYAEKVSNGLPAEGGNV